MARRGDLPVFVEHVDPRYGVPQRAVLLIGAVAAVVAATGTLREVASTASFTILVYYGIANLAALRMPRDAKLYPDAVPLVGMAACAGLAISLSVPVILLSVGVLAAGFALRSGLRRFG